MFQKLGKLRLNEKKNVQAMEMDFLGLLEISSKQKIQIK